MSAVRHDAGDRRPAAYSARSIGSRGGANNGVGLRAIEDQVEFIGGESPSPGMNGSSLLTCPTNEIHGLGSPLGQQIRVMSDCSQL
jgi:hypothetical protein